jgi:serine/threonine protein kinase/lipopolysaccharide biosynthesis regulator YciM
MIGQTINHYKITAKLGEGGMGEVYLATDTKLDREVALKFLPDLLAHAPEARSRFEREARAQASLNHPNVVTLHDIAEFEGRQFIVMERVGGKSLTAYSGDTKLTLEQLIDLTIQVAEGLTAAHHMGLVHRDLKPSNILVPAEGRAKICDFGLAYARNKARLTRSGSTLGTAAYMSPEQVQGLDVDNQSDLFSLGAVLYELITGQLPFHGEHDAAIAYAIVHEDPAEFSCGDGDIADQLRQAVTKLLAKRPVDRFASAAEFASTLRTLRSALQISDPSMPTMPQTPMLPSIAVLPFTNMSADPENEYFADGLTEELLNVLARISDLSVAARTSSFQFKGHAGDIEEIGSKLKVETVLEGSVRKAGNKVRITAQLVKVSNGYHLWSETYNRELDDIFAVQEDIARAVVQELKGRLLGSDHPTPAPAPVARSENAEVYNLYLQARFFTIRGSKDDLLKAIGFCEQAITLDPDYAPGWAMLASARHFLAGTGHGPFNEGFERARQAAEHALRLDPDLAEAHVVMGDIQNIYDWDWAAADKAYQRALELEPNNSAAATGAAKLAVTLGRADEAVDLLKRSVIHDPLNSYAFYRMGYCALLAQRYEEATEALERALELTDVGWPSRFMLSLVYIELNDPQRALKEAQQEAGEFWRILGLAFVYHKLGNKAEFDATLAEILSEYENAAAYQIAEVYAYSGQIDTAFEWLERSYALRDPGLTMTKADPFLGTLHNDPRWLPFIEKVGFPE